MREILEKSLEVLRRIGLGIRFLGGFTVLAGIAILAGAVSAGSARRGREVALLKTLGMTRRGVAGAFAVEYALIGLVAGVIGAVGGTVLAWGVVTRGFEMPWSFARRSRWPSRSPAACCSPCSPAWRRACGPWSGGRSRCCGRSERQKTRDMRDCRDARDIRPLKPVGGCPGVSAVPAVP